MAQNPPKSSFYFFDQLFSNNQVLVAVLGICSALGVTNRLSVGLTMGLSVAFVTSCSSSSLSFKKLHT